MTGDGLAELLADRRQVGGVLHWPVDGPAERVLAVARAAGWRALLLDLHGVADKTAFMARCADSLRFPHWFGRNWDALGDCLTDPDWPALPDRSAADSHRLVLVTGWRQYAAAAPGEWRTALDVLGEAATFRRQEPGAAGTLLVLLAEPRVTDRGHPTPGTSGSDRSRPADH